MEYIHTVGTFDPNLLGKGLEVADTFRRGLRRVHFGKASDAPDLGSG
jgi:hypothetical protein